MTIQAFLNHNSLHKSIVALGMTLACAFGAQAAFAQNPFSAAVSVNDSVVTHYEITQRALFLEVVRTPGDVRQQALETLVNERLQQQEAARLGVLATPEQIEAGVVEFAARAEMGPEQFLRAIGEEGVAPETFRDFVSVGISWRNVVGRRFGDAVRPGEFEAQEALLYEPRLDSARILIAEIVIPVTPENQDTLRSEMARLGRDLNGSTADFSEAARRFSAAGTRDNGGVTGWRPLTAVPPALREELVLLQPGQVFGPVPLGPAVALFQLRGLSEGQFSPPAVLSTEYATIPLPGLGGEETQAAAAALRADLDVCDDLYGERPGGFEIFDQSLREIPGDIAMALAVLDPGEMSFDVRRASADGQGTTTLAVMLCNRTVETPDGGLEAVAAQVRAQLLTQYADAFLEELRADAIIDYTP